MSHSTSSSVSAPAVGPSHDIRKDGGIPSSAAFASEQAKDAERFAALNPETRDQSIFLSTQMKRDFLVSQAAPTPPPSFAPAPSSATRSVSRTASMAGEASDSPSVLLGDDENLVVPVLLPNRQEVSKTLHLAGPPTTKAGQKEKAESPGVAAARANGNITRLGGHIIATNNTVHSHRLDSQSKYRGLESRLNRIDPEKLLSSIELVESMARTGIENLEGKPKDGSTGAYDARVSLHTEQIAQLTAATDTIRQHLELIRSSFLCDSDGVPIKDFFATKGDVNALWGSVQEGFDGLDEAIADGVADGIRPTEQKADSAATLAAKTDAKVASLEQDLLKVRENVARIQLEFGAALASKASTTTAASATAAPSSDDSRPGFTVGGKKNKRRASIELIAGPAKRANAKPDKGSYHHWKLVETALGNKYSMPVVYIERTTGEPAVINVGFSAVNDANTFIGAWSGASSQMPVGLRAVTAQLISVPGSSVANDTISFLTGN
ncbi:hypothetical protein B0H13DRAFT_2480531 [Mycena leptocephala]|nr:hypothetical protein B0H13DRAFT_2480531 [Mycena leptocephala]